MTKLNDGLSIIIIGGGPAGTSCAIYIKKLAEKLNKNLSVILIEPKSYGMHYNQCVGVIPPQIIPLLEEIGVKFPEHIIQKEVIGYHLSADNEEIYLPSDKHNDISFAVRRNEFDAFMMDEVLRAGVQIVPGEAVSFDYSKKDKKNKFVVYCNCGTYKGDFIIGAFGVGNGIAREFFKAFGYRPPRVLQSIITKIHPTDNSYIDKIFGNSIHAYLPKCKSIAFGAITPKGNHLTVNIAGEKISFKDMEYFLGLDEVKRWIPRHKKITFFKGQFPTRPAHLFYGDDYVIIGDAAGIVRPFKGKGIYSAIISGKIAAETIVKYGTTAPIIKRFFIDNPQISKILKDYKYGEITRRLTIQASHLNLLKYVIAYAKKSKIFEAALYSAVSANRLYKDIIFSVIKELIHFHKKNESEPNNS